MKKLLIVLSTAFLLTACGCNDKKCSGEEKAATSCCGEAKTECCDSLKAECDSVKMDSCAKVAASQCCDKE